MEFRCTSSCLLAAGPPAGCAAVPAAWWSPLGLPGGCRGPRPRSRRCFASLAGCPPVPAAAAAGGGHVPIGAGPRISSRQLIGILLDRSGGGPRGRAPLVWPWRARRQRLGQTAAQLLEALQAEANRSSFRASPAVSRVTRPGERDWCRWRWRKRLLSNIGPRKATLVSRARPDRHLIEHCVEGEGIFQHGIASGSVLSSTAESSVAWRRSAPRRLASLQLAPNRLGAAQGQSRRDWPRAGW